MSGEISELVRNKKESYGQVPSCDVLVELVEPLVAVPELEEQFDCVPSELLDKVVPTPAGPRTAIPNPVVHLGKGVVIITGMSNNWNVRFYIYIAEFAIMQLPYL